MRTYAQIQEPGRARQQAEEAQQPLTDVRGSAYCGWIEAVRAGRTFVTHGPLLGLNVNGHGPGSTVEQDSKPVLVEAEAVSVSPFDRLEIVRDGEVFGDMPCDECNSAKLAVTLPGDPGGWLAARCWSADGLSAHTSAIYLAGPSRTRDPSLAAPLFQRLDWLVAFAEDFAADTEQQKHLLEIAAKARSVLEKCLS